MTVYEDIRAERERQDARWGSDGYPDPFVAVAVLVEEAGEVARAVHDARFAPDGARADLRAELVQVAAVAVRWIEQLDRENRP